MSLQYLDGFVEADENGCVTILTEGLPNDGYCILRSNISANGRNLNFDDIRYPDNVLGVIGPDNSWYPTSNFDDSNIFGYIGGMQFRIRDIELIKYVDELIIIIQNSIYYPDFIEQGNVREVSIVISNCYMIPAFLDNWTNVVINLESSYGQLPPPTNIINGTVDMYNLNGLTLEEKNNLSSIFPNAKNIILRISGENGASGYTVVYKSTEGTYYESEGSDYN